MSPRTPSRLGSQRGTSVFEFVLALPLLALAIALFIGMGFTVSLRHHALVGARYAAFYQRVAAEPPPNPGVSKAVARLPEQWRVTAQANEDGEQVTEAVSRLGGLTGAVGSLFGSIMRGIGDSGQIHPKVDTTPNRGVVPKMMQLKTVSAEYYLPSGSWTSDECGSYLELLMDKVMGMVGVVP